MAYAKNNASLIPEMKICLPTNSNQGLQSELASNFSVAPWLLIVESDTQETLAIDMSDDEQRKKPVTFDLIMCQGMPEVLFQALRAEGVSIYGTRSKSVAGALADYWENDLHDLRNFSCCRGDEAACDGVTDCQES